ncbi:sigma-54 interaction domain-containing protein [Abyssisolibacter fermentans]|uniref:sigma-54 interaction domain-containing protein n=1 Tax=Abyssisolibacter fermentans TaxID=1766203 RepID=UPI00082E2EBF|nr:sigma 54-interacting transcriptional regulator [Abyssisolibacter fermentans]
MKLKDIGKYVQKVSENIAKVINADVTVVDVDRTRIAGTGRFVLKIGSKIDKNSFYNEILKTGQHKIFKGKYSNGSCKVCAHNNNCEEVFDICCPVKKGDLVVGVIGIVAFNESQKHDLVQKKEDLISFIYNMSDLLISKLENKGTNISTIKKTYNAITFDDIIGNNKHMQKAKDRAKIAAQSCSNILITGESGTGKEMFAQAIHNESKRSGHPFVAINCAAIPDGLLESELFGYEQGAFTGAKNNGKKGKFEVAAGGTIFLDEIGDMPLYLQSKLLRVLQERYIEHIGSNKIIDIDVRIISATHKNLEQLVKEGIFRNDLYYRLNVIPIYIPSLKEKNDDICSLMEKLLIKCNHKLNKNVEAFSKDVYEIFNRYDWPGNVRELENVIEYAINMEKSKVISIDSLPDKIKKFKDTEELYNDERIKNIHVLEKEEIVKALYFYGSNTEGIKKSAKALDIGVATLYRKIKKYQISI